MEKKVILVDELGNNLYQDEYVYKVCIVADKNFGSFEKILAQDFLPKATETENYALFKNKISITSYIKSFLPFKTKTLKQHEWLKLYEAIPTNRLYNYLSKNPNEICIENISARPEGSFLNISLKNSLGIEKKVNLRLPIWILLNDNYENSLKTYIQNDNLNPDDKLYMVEKTCDLFYNPIKGSDPHSKFDNPVEKTVKAKVDKAITKQEPNASRDLEDRQRAVDEYLAERVFYAPRRTYRGYPIGGLDNTREEQVAFTPPAPEPVQEAVPDLRGIGEIANNTTGTYRPFTQDLLRQTIEQDLLRQTVERVADTTLRDEDFDRDFGTTTAATGEDEFLLDEL